MPAKGGYSGELPGLIGTASGFCAFADIKGIKGDSCDEKHREWIDVLGIEWGVAQPAATGGGASQERADFDDLTIVKMFDAASPVIYGYCARGSKIDKIVIDLCHVAGDRHTFGVIKVSKATISRVQVTSAAGHWAVVRPVEIVSFRYKKIEWAFTAVDLDGKPGGKITGGWDLGSNTAV